MNMLEIEISARQESFGDTELRLVRVDKIASATVNLGLDHELVVTTRWPADETPRAGDVIVVRALTDSAT